MTKKQALRRVAENMTLGIALRPYQIQVFMDDDAGGACALGTIRAGQGIGSRKILPIGQNELSYTLQDRFGGGIVHCNDTLLIEREAMVQIACEDAGLA